MKAGTKKSHSRKHREVDTLPKEALRVSEYAKKNGHTTQWVYEATKRGLATFEIVVFKGINFIIPN